MHPHHSEILKNLDRLLEEDKNPQNIRTTLKNIFPEKKSSSRFSIQNPFARFSITPEHMRETIKAVKRIGKQDFAELLEKGGLSIPSSRRVSVKQTYKSTPGFDACESFLNHALT